MSPTTTDIIDVRTQNPPGTGLDDVHNGDPVTIVSGLSKPTHQRTLPTLLLYTETGLRIYDELTTKAADYYLFAAEEEILKKHGDEIIRAMYPRGCFVGESVVELGAGQVISPMSSMCFIAVDCVGFKSAGLSILGCNAVIYTIRCECPNHI